MNSTSGLAEQAAGVELLRAFIVDWCERKPGATEADGLGVPPIVSRHATVRPEPSHPFHVMLQCGRRAHTHTHSNNREVLLL